MTEVGLRELRQHASELVRRVEAGEEVTITVGGRPSAGELAISVVTIAELQFGVLVARDVATRAAAPSPEPVAVVSRPLPVDDAVADSYGRVAAAVVASGRQSRARTTDLLIAATAHAHAARLYTRNVDDFAGLADLVDVVAV